MNQMCRPIKLKNPASVSEAGTRLGKHQQNIHLRLGQCTADAIGKLVAQEWMFVVLFIRILLGETRGSWILLVITILIVYSLPGLLFIG